MADTLDRVSTLQLPIGYTCHNNCVFCCDGGRGRHGPRPDTAVLERILDRNQALGTVVFTAHEPTLNPDLPRLAKHAAEHGFETVSIITNGRRLGRGKLLDELLEAGVNCFHISIHAPAAELHDHITQTPGSFDQAVAGIRAIQKERRQRDVGLVLHTTVTNLNIDIIGQMVPFIGQFAPDAYAMNALFISGRALDNVDDVGLDFHTMVDKLADALDGCDAPFPVRVSEIPMCQALGRIPNKHLSMREAFHVPPRADDGTFLSTEADAITRGFVHGERCSSCFARDACDGIPQVYVERWGWDAFRPVTRSMLEASLFHSREELHRLLDHPSGNWEVDEIQVYSERAIVQISCEQVPAGLELILRQYDTGRPAYRRSKRFNVALKGRDHDRAQCRLAEEIVRQLQVTEAAA